MQREMEYRVWHSDHKKMEYAGITLKEDADGWDGVYGSVCGVVNSYLKNSGDRVWLEFTGLRDKLGKKIYEGDIVEFLYKHPEKSEGLHLVRCVIKWSDEGAWCLLWGGKDKYENGARLNPEKYTVVGNIYENSDLL